MALPRALLRFSLRSRRVQPPDEMAEPLLMTAPPESLQVSDLPTEILSHILSFLEPQEVFKLLFVSARLSDEAEFELSRRRSDRGKAWNALAKRTAQDRTRLHLTGNGAIDQTWLLKDCRLTDIRHLVVELCNDKLSTHTEKSMVLRGLAAPWLESLCIHDLPHKEHRKLHLQTFRSCVDLKVLTVHLQPRFGQPDARLPDLVRLFRALPKLHRLEIQIQCGRREWHLRARMLRRILRCHNIKEIACEFDVHSSHIRRLISARVDAFPYIQSLNVTAPFLKAQQLLGKLSTITRLNLEVYDGSLSGERNFGFGRNHRLPMDDGQIIQALARLQSLKWLSLVLVKDGSREIEAMKPEEWMPLTSLTDLKTLKVKIDCLTGLYPEPYLWSDLDWSQADLERFFGTGSFPKLEHLWFNVPGLLPSRLGNILVLRLPRLVTCGALTRRSNVVIVRRGFAGPLLRSRP